MYAFMSTSTNLVVCIGTMASMDDDENAAAQATSMTQEMTHEEKTEHENCVDICGNAAIKSSDQCPMKDDHTKVSVADDGKDSESHRSPGNIEAAAITKVEEINMDIDNKFTSAPRSAATADSSTGSGKSEDSGQHKDQDSSISSSSLHMLHGPELIKCELQSDWENTKLDSGISTNRKKSKSIEETNHGHFRDKLVRKKKVKYVCEVCGYCCLKKNHLVEHNRMHSGERPYICDTCGETFPYQSSLKYHILTHTGEKTHKCKECGMAFLMKCHLQQHVRTHTGEKPFSCLVCGTAFTQSASLKRHLKKHCKQAKPGDASMVDQKSATSPYTVARKRQTCGLKETPFACEECSKCFRTKSDLTRHRKVHSSEKPFHCAVCGELFRYKYTLVQHFRIHTGEKPFKCDICDASFSQSCNLTRHFRKHTGDKPFKCSVCNACFGQSTDLQRHKRKHTGERPFQCTMCPSAFMQSSHLMKHIKTRHCRS